MEDDKLTNGDRENEITCNKGELFINSSNDL